MLSRSPHWRQRLIDLAVVLVVLIFVGHVWPKIPLGTGATLSALVTESPGHLAMLPLDSGRNEVRLDYVGPPLVRAAFWVSAFSWIAVAGWAAWMFIQSWLARRANPVHST
jgi:hypothetical protein